MQTLLATAIKALYDTNSFMKSKVNFEYVHVM